MCSHYSYCGLPRIHKDKNFCLHQCKIKHVLLKDSILYTKIKNNCELLGIDKTERNNISLGIK